MNLLLPTLLALTLSPSAASQDPSPPPRSEQSPDQIEAKTVWEYLAKRYDKDGDGKISKAEYTRGEDQFLRLDKDGNGFIEPADTQASGGRSRGERGGRGERGAGGGRGERGQRGERGSGRGQSTAPSEGELAPEFQLESLYPLEEKSETKTDKARTRGEASKESEPKYESIALSSFKGKRPVALIFGSYT